MSYSPEEAARDAAMEDFYEEVSRQAISEFTSERLRSYYLQNPDLAVPGKRTFVQARHLYRAGQLGPALVCGVTVIEVFFKIGFLRPVLYGLVHSEPLAEAVVGAALSQPGYQRYLPLLQALHLELVGKELKSFSRKGSNKNILVEADEAQKCRNLVIHQGYEPTDEQARQAIGSAAIVMVNIWRPMLNALGLKLGAQGRVAVR